MQFTELIETYPKHNSVMLREQIICIQWNHVDHHSVVLDTPGNQFALFMSVVRGGVHCAEMSTRAGDNRRAIVTARVRT